MASLQISGLPGTQVATALHHAANIAAQRESRPSDVTIDLTAGVLTITDNRTDSGKTTWKF